MSSAVARPKRAHKKLSSLERIRNIGVVAHIDSGKTTITERILKLTGRIHRIGEVHDGEAEMDFLKEEQERGITIGSAVTNFSWGEAMVNLIDTPGHVDFTAEVERSLRVLDGSVLVIDSVAGAQAQSETVNRQMNKYQVSRIAFVNKMDRVGADFSKAVNSIRERLGLCAHPVQIPVGEGPEYCGAIDLVRMVQVHFPDQSDDPADFRVGDIDPEWVATATEARHELLEALSMWNDELMEMLLEDEDPPVELVESVIREEVCNARFVPVLLGSALRNRGVPALLDAIVGYLPSPLDKGAVAGRDPKSEDALEFDPDPEADLGALVFKTVHHPTGDLTFIRLYSGTFESGEALYNPRLGRHERIGRLYLVHAKSRESVERATAGQIVACMGLKESATGDTMCRKNRQIVYGATTFPKPVISMAIEPVSNADRDKLTQTLAVIAREDPTFFVETDRETGETIISGMGELHLEVVTHRLRDEFRLRVATGKPRVAYRQTLTHPAAFECRHIKQTGGSGQYAVAKVEIEPIDSEDIQCEDTITQGRVTKEFLDAFHKGVREYFAGGGSRGAPILGVKCTVVDGKMHDVDSSQVAFYACGVQAARMAEERCSPSVLEPVMAIEVTTPEEYLGAVLGDVNSRRGVVQEMGDEGMNRVVRARVPLSELAAYSTTLRSVTSGRGDYSMEPDGYQMVPQSLLEKLEK